PSRMCSQPWATSLRILPRPAWWRSPPAKAAPRQYRTGSERAASGIRLATLRGLCSNLRVNTPSRIRTVFRVRTTRIKGIAMTVERPWLEHYPAGVPAEIDMEEYASVVAVLDGAIGSFRDRPAF